jgi:hypothetical protein
MRNPAASPRLIKFVRRALRADPKPSFEDVLARWRGQQGGEVEPELVRAVYDEELAGATQPAMRDANYSRIVLVTLATWLVVHVALALALGLPTYITCRQSGSSSAAFGGCGFNLGVSFLLAGLAQVVYGVVLSVVAYQLRRPVAQGILIGMGIVVVLFTAVCFGAAGQA